MKSITDLLRRAAVQYQLSKALEPFISEIGRTDPHLTKTTKEEILKKSLDLLNKVTGHGLSEEKSLEIKAEIDKMNTAREIFKYMSNLMLAGMGQKVVMADRTAPLPDKDEYFRHLGIHKLEHAKDMKELAGHLHTTMEDPHMRAIEKALDKDGAARFGLTVFMKQPDGVWYGQQG